MFAATRLPHKRFEGIATQFLSQFIGLCWGTFFIHFAKTVRNTKNRSIKPGSHKGEFCLFKYSICQYMPKNKCDPTLKKLSNFWQIAKIPPIFKEAEVLPLRLPNFGNRNNFVFLTI